MQLILDQSAAMSILMTFAHDDSGVVHVAGMINWKFLID